MAVQSLTDIYKILDDKNASIDVYDPNANKNELKKYFNISLMEFKSIKYNKYDSIVVGVAHEQFKTINIEKFGTKKVVIFDSQLLIYNF